MLTVFVDTNYFYLEKKKNLGIVLDYGDEDFK